MTEKRDAVDGWMKEIEDRINGSEYPQQDTLADWCEELITRLRESRAKLQKYQAALDRITTVGGRHNNDYARYMAATAIAEDALAQGDKNDLNQRKAE